jgi:glycosyltransferase involved in cell wall biosynthesis
MKVLLLNTTDLRGGAARAAYRLHQGLQSIDVNSQMLVQEKLGDDPTVFSPQTSLSRSLKSLRPRLNRFPLKLYPQLGPMIFSPQWVPDDLSSQVAKFNPDIIHLHWICEGFLQVETIPKFTQPLVWTLHDMWPFTGGCHYSEGCDHFLNSCGNCPLLKSDQEKDLTHWVWTRKAKAWQNLNLTLVSPSVWLANCTRSSSLFKNYRIEVIPNGINLELYKPLVNCQEVRSRFNLPLDKQLIVCGSTGLTGDRWKGFNLLVQSLQSLSKSDGKERIEVVFFGSSQPENPIDVGLKTHYLGNITDEVLLTQIYGLADVFVAPSIYDNLPNTVMEALASGTPCVGFKIGGLPDLIEHHQNGYLAQPYEIEDLARGITWVLENQERHQKLSKAARQKAEKEYSLEVLTHRYLALFNDILSRNK